MCPTPDTPDRWFRTERLTCERGGRLLFAELDFEARAHEQIWVRGPNGCGKTTLLRTLVGLSRPVAGRVHWRAAARPRFLGHGNALKDDLTVNEALRFAAHEQGLDVDEAALGAALDRLSVRPLARRTLRSLSQGQRRRVALSRLALSDAPACWLLDEPFDALDAQAIEQLCALLRENAQRGGCVVFTSHQSVDALAPGLRCVDLPQAAARSVVRRDADVAGHEAPR